MLRRWLQLAAVGGDDVFVPVEGLLAGAGAAAGAIVMQVDIDKAVALLVLAGGKGGQVDAWRAKPHTWLTKYPLLIMLQPARWRTLTRRKPIHGGSAAPSLAWRVSLALPCLCDG